MKLTNDGLEVILRALGFGKIDPEFVNDATAIYRDNDHHELVVERGIGGMRFEAKLK